MKPKDYYQVLGISREATTAQVKAAFRKLSLRHHPDKDPDNPNAEERFQEIHDAYKTLSNETKRAEYDLQSRLRSSDAQFVEITLGGFGVSPNAPFVETRQIIINGQVIVDTVFHAGNRHDPLERIVDNSFSTDDFDRVEIYSNIGYLNLDVSSSGQIIFNGTGMKPQELGSTIRVDGFQGNIVLPIDANVALYVDKGIGVLQGHVAHSGTIRTRMTRVDLNLVDDIGVQIYPTMTQAYVYNMLQQNPSRFVPHGSPNPQRMLNVHPTMGSTNIRYGG